MNIARLLYVGAMKMGYTERELFWMTPRKFFLIYDEYFDLNGLKKPDENAIDMLP